MKIHNEYGPSAGFGRLQEPKAEALEFMFMIIAEAREDPLGGVV